MPEPPSGQPEGMLNPLSLPADVLAALRSVANIERLLDERLEAIEDRLREFDAQMAQLPADLERTLRPHLERQQDGIDKLYPELVATREHAETLPGKVDGLRGEIRAVNDAVSGVDASVGADNDSVGGVRDELRAATAELRGVLAEVGEVRETVEPLQGPAERMARLSERLPGGG